MPKPPLQKIEMVKKKDNQRSSSKQRFKSILLDDVDGPDFGFGKPKKYFSNMGALKLEKGSDSNSTRSAQVITELSNRKKWETSK